MKFTVCVTETRTEAFYVEAESAECAEERVRAAFLDGARPQLSEAFDLDIAAGGSPDGRHHRDFDDACDEDEVNVCSVESRIGTLRADVWGEGAIVVELVKHDGTCGDVALVEVTPSALLEDCPTGLHTFAYDGEGEEPAVRVDVDPHGSAMQYR